eukprot:CAMPEP_0181295514 /NCGR_PEP_ID=MMETSP1101-20121128/4191_1 /TAXON_ID=46948 /ORGANISM="Rhodomonas abbreviata, Strain Caron Lab Isolate" /LENGTH=1052 /DNA_ID=CAMNT_0023400277 /DNA_START=89 /DNA_END=3247 /DNA_ORIENTATION=+
MFFDSSLDTRKKVSLGGKSRGKTQESKQEFVARTRKEREARELERKRERASLNIQAFFRGRKVTRALRELEREGWDAAVQAMKSAWAQAVDEGSYGEIGTTFNSLLRRLLFFFRPDRGDNSRLSSLELWLVVNGTAGPNKNAGVKLLSFLFDGAGAHEVERRIRRLCTLCLNRLKLTVHQPPGNEQALDAGLLLKLCHRSAYEKRGVAESLLAELLRSGLMRVVRARLDADDNADAASREPLQLVLISLVVQALGGGDTPMVEGAYDELCAHLLTRPTLFRRLSQPAQKVLKLEGLWEQILHALTTDSASLCDKVCSAESSIEAPSNLLGNLVDLSTTCLSTSSPKETGLFALSAGKVLAHVRELQDSLTISEEDAIEMEEAEEQAEVETERMEVEIETAAGPTRVQHTRIRKKMDSFSVARLTPALAAVKLHVQAICNKEYIYKLLDVVQKVPPPTSQRDSSGDTPPQDFLVVSATCGLLMQLLEFLPEATTDVLNALAFKPAVLSMLWDWFKCVSKGGSGVVDGEDSLLTMFCLVYHHLLMTVDNTEFYENQYPFSLAQVRDMVDRLKGSVYALYWAPPSSVIGKRLRASGTALLNRLFERNCYKQFAPPEAWLAPDRYVNAVMSELDGWSAARLDPGLVADDGMDKRHTAVLRSVPFALPFPLRVRILRHQIAQDKNKLMDVPMNWIPTRVQRSRVVEDGYLGLNALGPDLKRTIQISFVNQEGLLEAGIDGGDKEFVNTLSGQAFNPHYGLFSSTPDGLLFPNPQAETAHPWQGTMDHLKLMEFLGRIVGKAIYDGILIELRMAPFFLRKMLGKEMFFDDLKSLDPELYKNLMFVKNYTGDFEDLALNFVVVEDNFGEVRTTELMEGGNLIPVTPDNVLRYKNLVSDYWLNRRIQQQSQAFMRGISDLMEPEWLRMFSPDELQMIISGSVQPIDLEDWRRNCVYGGYTEDHDSVQLFWRVVETFNKKEREDLLMFVTSCSRPPLLGFKELFPAFCIQKTAHPPEEANSRLPTASTCMNLLKLPAYSSEEDCRERILYAISAGAGFELS